MGAAAPERQQLPVPAAARPRRHEQQQQQHHEQQQQQQRRVSPAEVAAGLLTSALYTTATFPVHRVKTLLQTQHANPDVLSGRVARYGFAHAFGRLVREQGLPGLWRGNTPYLLRHVPSVALSLSLKDALRGALLPLVPAGGGGGGEGGSAGGAPGAGSPLPLLAANALAGGLGGALALAAVYPFEWATVRMSADVGQRRRQYGDTLRAVWRQAVRREGPSSVYRGFGVSVGSTFAYKGLFFSLYDTGKPLVLGAEEHGRHAATTPSGLALRAGLAAATTFVSATAAYPLDVVRKRLIVDTAADAPLYGGSLRRCVREIARREGLRGFYRAWPFDIAFRVFGGAVLVGYDLFNALLAAGSVGGGG